MDSALSDKRFANVVKDPKFRRVPTATRKVTIDKRFNSMFNDKRFKLKYSVDKRGKPISLTSNEQLKDFYEIESDEEEDDEDAEEAEEIEQEEEPEDESEPSTSASKKKAKSGVVKGFTVTSVEEGKKTKDSTPVEEISDDVRAKLLDLNVDYARGEGLLFSDSSSDEEDSAEEEEDDDTVYHDWGELDKDAGETDTATRRLAVCNMDWDRIRAVDLLVLLNSFAPQGGAVQKVTIYPSEFGMERMKEEEVLGPKELVEASKQRRNRTEDGENQKNGDEDEEQDEYHREKLRQYQLNRLKYYYAVVECDSDATAAKIYEECDGHEFESSSARLDLRFIPDDMDFDQAPRDVCDAMPDTSQYEPRIFMNSALQQAEVHLTWDETDPSRMQTMQKLFQNKKGKQKGGDIDDQALKDFLATSSEEEDEEEEDEPQRPDSQTADDLDACSSTGESSRIAKYRSLLASLAQQEEKGKKKDTDMEMEITWGVGLKEKAEQMVKKKLAEKAVETPWEQQLAKRRETRKAKREEKKKQQKQLEVASGSSDEEDDDIPSDIDMNDPYFREEFEKEEFRRKDGPKGKTAKSKSSKEAEKDREETEKADELELLLMDENDGKRHFSLKSIMKNEGIGKKNKKGKAESDEVPKDAKDKDFKVQVEDPRFSALFTSHHYNLDPSDPNFRQTEGTMAILQEKQKRRIANDVPTAQEGQPDSKMSKGDPELSRLVRSVKIKTTMQKNQQKYKTARP